MSAASPRALFQNMRGGADVVELLIAVALIAFVAIGGVEMLGAATERKFVAEAAWLAHGDATPRTGEVPAYSPTGITRSGGVPDGSVFTGQAIQVADADPEIVARPTRDVLSDLGRGALLGSFDPEPTLAGSVGQVALGLTPVGWVADVRDITAAIDDVRQDREGAWVGLGIGIAGIAPLGDSLKLLRNVDPERALPVVGKAAGVAVDLAKGKGFVAVAQEKALDVALGFVPGGGVVKAIAKAAGDRRPVLHRIPGRMRIKMPELIDDRVAREDVRRALATTFPDVKIEVNDSTGSFLFTYPKGSDRSEEILTYLSDHRRFDPATAASREDQLTEVVTAVVGDVVQDLAGGWITRGAGGVFDLIRKLF